MFNQNSQHSQSLNMVFVNKVNCETQVGHKRGANQEGHNGGVLRTGALNGNYRKYAQRGAYQSGHKAGLNNLGT